MGQESTAKRRKGRSPEAWARSLGCDKLDPQEGCLSWLLHIKRVGNRIPVLQLLPPEGTHTPRHMHKSRKTDNWGLVPRAFVTMGKRC
jgi:hypothetical protein